VLKTQKKAERNERDMQEQEDQAECSEVQKVSESQIDFENAFFIYPKRQSPICTQYLERGLDMNRSGLNQIHNMYVEEARHGGLRKRQSKFGKSTALALVAHARATVDLPFLDRPRRYS